MGRTEVARSKVESEEPARREVEGAKLEPMRVVRRELVGPDGSTVEVDVPVYPPFRLMTPEERTASEG